MKLSRKPAGQTKEESLLFYATKVSLIQRELSLIGDCYILCENYHEEYLEDNHGVIHREVTKCKYLNIEPCQACRHNKLVYAEKRKLSNQLSKTMPQLIKYSDIDSDAICKKIEPSFVDKFIGDEE